MTKKVEVTKTAKNKWTIMVYMVGDNNLSQDMVTSIIGLRSKNLVTCDNLAVMAYYDNNTPNLPTAYFDFTPPQKGDSSIQRLPTDEGFQIAKQPLNYERSASAISIKHFIQWCKDRHPADNYALIFSGHGDGFQPNTFLHDDSPNTNLTVHGLRAILTDVCQKILEVPKFDVLGFDSCVMSTAEVAYEMQDTAKFLVSSQGFVPNSGWSYSTLVDELVEIHSESGLTAENVAKTFAETYIRGNRAYAKFSDRSVDISICDLEKIGDLADAVFLFGDKLKRTLESSPEIKEPLKRAILNSHWKSQTYVFDQCVDIKDFCQNLISECNDIATGNQELLDLLKSVANPLAEIVEKTTKVSKIITDLEFITKAADATNKEGLCANVVNAVEQCATSYYLGPDFQYSNGLSMFFPWSSLAYTITYQRYNMFDFAIDKKAELSKQSKRIAENSSRRSVKKGNKSGWVNFLEYYLIETLREIRQPQLQTPAGTPRNQFPATYFFNAGSDNFVDSVSAESFKINPVWNTLNPPWSKLNRPLSRLDRPISRLDRPISRLFDCELDYFRSTKNFPLGWQPLDDDRVEKDLEQDSSEKIVKK